MINRELRNQVDKLWTEFWTGGITNPLMVIEQISFLMFARLLDIRETREEKKAKRTGKDFSRIFPEGKQNHLGCCLKMASFIYIMAPPILFVQWLLARWKQ